MASLAVTNTFIDGATITAAGFNTNYSDIVSYINNRNSGGTAWDALSITGSTVLSGSLSVGTTSVFTGNASFAGTITCTNASSSAILAQAVNSGGTVGMFIDNSSNTASSDARLGLRVAGTSANDPFINMSVSGSTTWSIGLDNSDSDRFKLSKSSALGSNDYIIVDPTTTSVSITGTNTNDSASAGYVGEILTSSVSNVTVGTSAQYYDVTSISLTAGDWDLSGVVVYGANSATFTSTDLELGISSTSGNASTGLTQGSNYIIAAGAVPTSFSNMSLTIPAFRVSVATTTTYYLKGFVSVYTAGSPKHWGRLSARRVR